MKRDAAIVQYSHLFSSEMKIRHVHVIKSHTTDTLSVWQSSINLLGGLRLQNIFVYTIC